MPGAAIRRIGNRHFIPLFILDQCSRPNGIRFAHGNVDCRSRLRDGAGKDAMNQRARSPVRSFWRRWPIVGLITCAFLAHDAGMASMAADGGALSAPGRFASGAARVIHVVPHDDTARTERDHSTHPHCLGAECSAQSNCGLRRESVPPTTDPHDVDVQSMISGLELLLARAGSPRAGPFTDAMPLSARDRRTRFQVFLI